MAQEMRKNATFFKPAADHRRFCGRLFALFWGVVLLFWFFYNTSFVGIGIEKFNPIYEGIAAHTSGFKANLVVGQKRVSVSKGIGGDSVVDEPDFFEAEDAEKDDEEEFRNRGLQNDILEDSKGQRKGTWLSDGIVDEGSDLDVGAQSDDELISAENDGSVDDIRDATSPYGNEKAVEVPEGINSITDLSLERRQVSNVAGLHRCATVEEMGEAALADTNMASLQVRRLIQDHLKEHGAQKVRTLPAEQFCERGFVFARAQQDGFGNEMYKVLNAAGLAIILNRSLIIGEQSSTNPAYLGLSDKLEVPFGNYITYSDETFSMKDVKHLWARHDCAGKYHRPLHVRLDSIERPQSTSSLCEDWTEWSYPIIWYKGAQDAVGLQLFLKNIHPKMQTIASKLLGDLQRPSTRPNLFGELMKAFIFPTSAVQRAVDWALQDGMNPDIALHMRMGGNRSQRAVQAACSCMLNILRMLNHMGRKLRIVVVSDTPSIVFEIKQLLGSSYEVVSFNYQLYINSSLVSDVMKENYFQPPRKRIRDWGSLPRWVAIVDFFLAARAKYAVVSGGHKRVAATYAQLIASLSAAHNLDEHASDNVFSFYSSFQGPLLSQGLLWQNGWGHSWHSFAGNLSCHNQGAQCAQTPLLPYAWWDGPWQSPLPRLINKLTAFGVYLDADGKVDEQRLVQFCHSRKHPLVNVIKLELPPCSKLKSCF